MVGTQKSGAIAADETWGGEGFPAPIQVVGDITVNSGAVLSILPGCEIVAEGNYKITIVGSMVAGGDPRGRIVFRAWNRARKAWTGLVWSQAGSVDSLLQEVDVLDAAKGLEPTTTPAAKVRAIRSRFENCDLALTNKLQSFVGERVTLQRNRVGIDSSVTWGASSFIRGRIRENDVGISVTAGTLTLSDQLVRVFGNRVGADVGGGTTMIAENVSWGHDAGPQHSTVPGGLGDPITGTGTVDVTPWTELGLYCTAEEVRVYCSKIVREVGTAGLEDAEALLSEEDLEITIKRVMGSVDSMYSSDVRSKPLFARGTETNEEVDVHGPLLHGIRSGYLHVKYRPIRAVTSVERRFGAQWQSLPNEEWTGWYASQEMLNLGIVHVRPIAASQMAAYRISYTHGHDAMPADVRDATVKASCLEVLSAILPIGAQDTYQPRTQRIYDELEETRKRLAGQRVGWAV